MNKTGNSFVALLLIAFAALSARAAEPVLKPSADEEVTLDAFAAWIKSRAGALNWRADERQPVLTREILLQSLRLGQRFMVNNQRPEGNFNYEYDFVARSQNTDDNPVRQAGAVWGLALAFQFDQNPATRAALDAGLRFFFAHTIRGPDGVSVIAYPRTPTVGNTGTVALVSLAIIEYLRAELAGDVTLDPAWKSELTNRLDGYLIFLKGMLLPDHHFSDKIAIREGKPREGSNPYADGEALLCFAKAAKYLDRHDLVPLLEKSALVMARDYTADAWRENADSDRTKGFFQWGCMAFWEYHDAGWRGAETMGDTALCMAWWMIHVHRTLSRARNTGYAHEGLIHAWRIARDRKDLAAMRDLAGAVDQGLTKLTAWQVAGPLAEKNPFLSANPTDDPLAVGGILNHAAEPGLRIDVTQHQMHAVMLALRDLYPQ